MSEAQKRRAAAMTREEKAEKSRKMRAGVNPEKLSNAMRKVHARRLADGSDVQIRQKIRARRLQNGDWSEYDQSEWAEYRRRVRQVTDDQPLSTLPNHEKRGRGKDKFHLDHIVSTKYGFDLGIPYWLIGHISNLRFIPEGQNCSKQQRVDEDEVLRLWFTNTEVFE